MKKEGVDSKLNIPKKIRTLVRKIGLMIYGKDNVIALFAEEKERLLKIFSTDIGDIVIQTFPAFGLRFRNGCGGTLSLCTWNALRFIHVAMHLDKDKVEYSGGSLKKITENCGNRYVARNLMMPDLQELDLQILLQDTDGTVERVHDDCDGNMNEKLVVKYIKLPDTQVIVVTGYQQSMGHIVRGETTRHDPDFVALFEEIPWTFMALKLLAVAMLMDIESESKSRGAGLFLWT